jgi:hypothetical protein
MQFKSAIGGILETIEDVCMKIILAIVACQVEI